MSKVRNKTYVELDSITEKDMLDKVEELKENRQLSSFVTSCVKYVLENPRKQDIVMKRRKDAEERQQFFVDIDGRVGNIEKCLSDLNEELIKLKGFISLNKMLCMEDRIDNLLCAELVLRRQIRSLNISLGRVGKDLVIDSKYIKEDFEAQAERAESMLEFAIEHYDGIINELRVAQAPREVQMVPVEVLSDNKKEKNSEKEPKKLKPEPETETGKKEESRQEMAGAADAIDNMSDEDLDALTAFFGSM